MPLFYMLGHHLSKMAMKDSIQVIEISIRGWLVEISINKSMDFMLIWKNEFILVLEAEPKGDRQNEFILLLATNTNLKAETEMKPRSDMIN